MKRIAWIAVCALALVGCLTLILLCVLLLTHGTGALALAGQLWAGPASRPRPYKVDLCFDTERVETTCLWVLNQHQGRASAFQPSQITQAAGPRPRRTH